MPTKVIGTIVALGMSCLPTYYCYKKSQQDSYELANNSKERVIPRLHKYPGRINACSNDIEIQAPQTPVKLSPWSQVAFRSADDGSILIDLSLTNRDGVVVGELRDSRLHVAPGLGYDVNSDEDALEVVDPDGIPVLQAVRLPSEVISLSYVAFRTTKSKQRIVEICDASGWGKMLQTNAGPRLKAIPKLFRYPGFKNPGVRANAESPTPWNPRR